MPATDEDRRQAASIFTSISTYVATGTIGVLAGAVALLTYFAQSYHDLIPFSVLLAVAVLMLAKSLYRGGRGINAIAKKGAGGDWDIGTRSADFNWQALLALAGTGTTMLAVVAALAFGTSNEDSRPSSTVTLGSTASTAITHLSSTLTSLVALNRADERQLTAIASALRRLHRTG